MAEKTYVLDIDGIGRFVMRRRNFALELRIAAEVNRIVGGQNEVSEWLMGLAQMVAALKVLVVEGPKNWDIDEMDPDDPDSYAALYKIIQEVRQREATFRQGNRDPRPRAGNADELRLAVSETLEPGAD